MKFAEKQPFERRRTGSPTVLALAVAAALAGTAPTLAEAAGLGRLTVQSALGQPLRAEVEVTALGREEAGSLSARLASPDAFRQAGLEFNSALTSLRFAVDRRTNGAAVVRITSSQPINEPFVDLLVELNWASGKFVREYTFLLDPPELRVGRETVAGGPSQIVPATTAGVSAAAAPAPVAQPTQAASGAASGVVAPPAAAPARAATRSAAAAPAPAESAGATAPAPSAPADGAPGSTGNEVTVRQGETLATIAARVKPADVSLEQAIVAIYNANPRAFFGSVHQMLAGAHLTVPDRSTMAAVDAGEARRQIREQAAVFNAYRERLAAAARRVEPARAGQSATGSVTAQVQDSAAGAGAGDQLKLSRPEGGTAGAGSATGSAAASAAEGRVARDAAVHEQQDRIDALEKNVADLQQLLELKNRQLAEMQKQVESARAAATTASGAVGAVAGAAGGSAAGGSAAAPGAVAQAPSSGAPSAAAPAAGTSPSTEAGSGGSTEATAGGSVAAPPAGDAASAATDGAAGGTETPAAAPAPAATAAPSPAPAAEPGFFEQLADNPLVLPGAAAIVLALGAYGLYAVRRRKKSEKFEDSLIAADAFTANSLFGSTGGQTVDTNNSLFPASGRDSGVDVHSTEVDPIAEAEVYIAYGREAQAEEILKEALKKQPERQAIRLKLLEIHAGRKDAVAFAAVAQEMYDMTGGQNEEWPKVVTLGLSIDPANPLYTGQGDGAAPAQAGDGQAAPPSATGASGAAALSAAATAAAAMLGDRLAPASGAEAAPPAAGGAFAETVPMDGEQVDGTAGEVPALDFDLDLDTTIGRAADRRTAGAAASQPTPADSDLSRAIEGRFDLPSLDIELPAQAGAEEPQALADLGDFKIDLPALEGLDTQPAAEESAALDETPAIDFGDVDFGRTDGHGAAHELSGGELELATADAAVAPGADSSRWQEMATKLDLASAYEEIGDKEGARELLEEVLRGGDLTQQQKARSMLAKIG
ncbi:MAG: pilus assembly protein FimV [Burkholderiales bacterium]|nr:pilus assembly protein FimV [Burkholderiales bacterium]